MTGFLSSPLLISLVVACLVGIALYFYFRHRNEQIENRINSVYEFVKNEALIRNKQQELQLDLMRAQMGEEQAPHVSTATAERGLINVSDNEGEPAKTMRVKMVREQYAESEEEAETSDEEDDGDEDNTDDASVSNEQTEVRRVQATLETDELPVKEITVRKVTDKVQSLKDELQEDNQVFREAPVSEFSGKTGQSETGVNGTIDNEIWELVGLQNRENRSNGENAGEGVQYVGVSSGDDGQPLNVVDGGNASIGGNAPIRDGPTPNVATNYGDTTEAVRNDTRTVPATSGGITGRNTTTDGEQHDEYTSNQPTDDGASRPFEYVGGDDTHQDGHPTNDLDTESSASLKIIRHSTTQKSTSSVVTHITDIQTLLGRRLPVTTVKKLTMPVLKSLAVHKGILPDMETKIRKNDLVDLFMKHQEDMKQE